MSQSSPFEVMPLGVGNYFTRFRYCTSLLLFVEGKRVLVDCPDPFFRMCADAEKAHGRTVDINSINSVILTHLHGDHCNGLEGFGFYKKFIQRSAPVNLYTTHEAAKSLWSKLRPSMGSSVLPKLGIDDKFEMSDFYTLHGFNFGDAFQVEGLSVETRRTQHTVPCYGFKATYKGRVFGYSCDTTFDPELIDFLAPADLIFHECDLGIHTHQHALEALPEAIRKKMHLVHLSDTFAGSEFLAPAEAGRVYPV